MTTLEWARFYRSLGFSVLPLLPKTKVPAITSWRQLQVRPAPDWELKLWFTSIPDANLGIITGEVSGIFVVDYDNPALIPHAGQVLDCVYSSTGRGAHYYYQYPDFPVCNRTGIQPGIDIRGNGGYVAAPPSIHPDGPVYTWMQSPEHKAIPDAPCSILNMLQPKERYKATLRPSAGAHYWAQVALEREWDTLLGVCVGQRNCALNRAAYNLGQLVGDDLLTRQHVETILTDAARSIGLETCEAERTIRSGIETGIINPRSLRVKHGSHNH